MTKVIEENVAARLKTVASLMPSAISIAEPEGAVQSDGARSYRIRTFEALDRRSDEIAKGLSEWQVITKHALRGGLIPVVAFLGPAFAGLLAGSFVVETIFQIPGLGRFYVQAAFNRDYTMILGTTVFLSTLIVVFNLLSDIAAAWLNPRLRGQFQRGRS